MQKKEVVEEKKSNQHNSDDESSSHRTLEMSVVGLVHISVMTVVQRNLVVVLEVTGENPLLLILVALVVLSRLWWRRFRWRVWTQRRLWRIWKF